MHIKDIARVCHDANRTLQIVNNGPAVPPPWDDTPEWQRESAIDDVARTQVGESPEELRRCRVPYTQLSSTERLKEDLFRAIVKALT